MSTADESEIVISVRGLPPTKGGLSIISPEHRHHARVFDLLSATRDALPAGFVPYRTAVSLTLVVHAPTPAPPGDPTNFLGGIADVLQRKVPTDAFGALGLVHVYENDLQLRRVEYEQRLAPETSYEVRLRSLGGVPLIGDSQASDAEPLVAELAVDIVDRDDLAIEFVNIIERARRRDLRVEDALSLLAWLDLQNALADSFLVDVREAVLASNDLAMDLWTTASRFSQALQRLFLGERQQEDLALLTHLRRGGARFELIDLDVPRPVLATAELHGGDIDIVFWPIVWSALGVLRPPVRDRVGVCSDENCGRLFVDRTKNGSKTWCSSQCTNRAKVRAYRIRQSGLSESALTYVVD